MIETLPKFIGLLLVEQGVIDLGYSKHVNVAIPMVFVANYASEDVNRGKIRGLRSCLDCIQDPVATPLLTLEEPKQDGVLWMTLIPRRS